MNISESTSSMLSEMNLKVSIKFKVEESKLKEKEGMEKDGRFGLKGNDLRGG